MIVVDIGSYPHGAYHSIGSLCRYFKPEIVYGFDPLEVDGEWTLEETGTRVVTKPVAAWTYDGEVLFTEAGTQSALGTETATPSTHPRQPTRSVPCFDLAAWIKALPEDELVVKIDVEGSEIALMKHLHETGADERISLLLVEEHPHLSLGPLPTVACTVGEWWM